MNIIIHSVVLFIFLLIVLVLNIAKINNNNISAKVYLFSSIFIFECCITFVTMWYNRRIINTANIAKKSLYIALVASVAYSVYGDITNYKYSFDCNGDNELANNIKLSLFTSVIVLFAVIIDTMITVISPSTNDYLNNVYNNKIFK